MDTVKVLRCLRQAPGTTVHVLSTDRRSCVRFSRHCARFHYHSSQNDDDWIGTIEKIVRPWKIDVVLPATLRGIRLISQRSEAISRICAIPPVPKSDLLELANNKWSLYQLAKQHALPVVPSVLIRKTGGPITDSQDLNSIEYPALLKPTSMRGGFGIVKVDRPSDLHGAWSDKRIMKDSEYILQSLVPAVDLSLAVFCKSGEVLAYTLWRELVPSKKPFRMPQLVEYTDDEQALDVGKRLLSEIGWDGVANIDLVFDKRDKTVKILEVNPRFWQSLLGSLTAGVNFPLMACLSALGAECPDMRQTPRLRYARPAASFQMLLSRLVGKGPAADFRWRDSGFRFIYTDPLPELAHVLRATVSRIRRAFG
ncbi:MAG: ATP-grasp domain-containing protein [Planctomycetota bacterium]